MSIAIAQRPASCETVGGFLGRTKKLLIGGEWMDSASSAAIAVYDPATEEQMTAANDSPYGLAASIWSIRDRLVH